MVRPCINTQRLPLPAVLRWRLTLPFSRHERVITSGLDLPSHDFNDTNRGSVQDCCAIAGVINTRPFHQLELEAYAGGQLGATGMIIQVEL